MDFFVLATAYSAIATKLVDAVRYFDKSDDPRLKLLWISLSMVFGVALSLLYELDYSEAIQGLPERFASLTGTGAQIVTGLAIGAYASGLHELFDALSGVAKRAVSSGTQN